ncbi:MAG TPA: TIGR02996 domain-containing protein [Kofleriaceae bacterium]|nr:TIGR02996 domain-containing protein [Kofleriaceae bacterium]
MAELDALHAAAAALDAGDTQQALHHALAAWRVYFDPELAAAIEQLGRRVEPPARLPAKLTEAERLAWIERDDPADLEQLVAMPLPRGLADFLVRLRAFGKRAPDPRYARWLRSLAASPAFGQNKYWKAVFDAMQVDFDPRTRAFVEGELAARLPQIARPSALDYVERQRAHLATVHTSARREPPALSPDQRASLARIVAQLARTDREQATANVDGDALLAAIRANPADDKPRLVYADWLQERGDPRGELIALQLSGRDDAATTRRERALLAEHARSWLGPLGAIATVARTRFARGFAVEVVLNARTAAQLEAVVGAPEWFSVENVAFLGPQSDHEVCAAIVAHPVMQSLRRVHNLGNAPLAKLLGRDEPLPLTTLGIKGFGRLADELRDTRLLPHVRRIVIDRPGWITGMAEVSTLLAMPLARQLDRIAVVSGTTTFELRRDGDRWARLVIEFDELPARWPRGPDADDLEALAALVPIAHVELASCGIDLDLLASGFDAYLGRLAQLPRTIRA